jgi:hypothetical protein
VSAKEAVAMNLTDGLLLAATVSSAIAGGATLDQTVKQLPARHRIGAEAYTAYARAADLSNGLVWYPVMGIGTTVLVIGAVVAGLLDHPSASRAVALAAMAAGIVVFAGATSRAAPTLLTLRRGEPTEATATATLDRFARFNAIRAAGIVMTIAASVWAMAASVG